MKEVRKRGAVSKEETWAVEDLYPSTKRVWKAAKRFETMLEKFSSYKGTLDASAQQFYEALEAYSAVGKLFERIYVYANEKLHEDMGNPVQQKLAGETDVLRNRYGAMISWIEPEIVRIPEVILEKFYEDEPRLLKYRIFLQRILQAKAHTLSSERRRCWQRRRSLARRRRIFSPCLTTRT